METNILKKVEVWFSVNDGGDGSAYPSWFLTEEDAEKDQEVSIEESGSGWGESCTGRVETFEGSNVHKYAVENSAELIERIKALEKKEEL